MLHTAGIDMMNSVKPSDIDIFLQDAAWAIHSTHHTVLKASLGAAIFGQDMLFDILFIADWMKIEELRCENVSLLPVRHLAMQMQRGKAPMNWQLGL
jgi:hypothetical protein